MTVTQPETIGLGDWVIDRKTDKKMIVVVEHDKPAGEHVFQPETGKTVLDVNPDSDPEARVVSCVYAEAADRVLSGKWDSIDVVEHTKALRTSEIVPETPLFTAFDFPVDRLKRATTG